MQNVAWPVAAKIADFTLNVKAHSRGGAGSGGHYSYERGPGAHWEGELTIPPMVLADAFSFRAFLHSLRGRSGTFLLALPSPIEAEGSSVFATTLSASAAALADTIALTSVGSAGQVAIGNYLVVDGISTVGQLFRITGVSGLNVTVRPRLRIAYSSSTAVTVGRVIGKFRLNGNTPAVPMVSLHSLSLKLPIAEAY